MPVGGGQESVMLSLQEYLFAGTWRRSPGAALLNAATLNVMLAERRRIEGWSTEDLPDVASNGVAFTEGTAVQQTPSVQITHLGLGEERRNSRLYDHLLVVNVFVKPKDCGNSADKVLLACMRISDEIVSMLRREGKARTFDGTPYVDGAGNTLNNGGTGSAGCRIVNVFPARGGPVEPRRRPRSENGRVDANLPASFYIVPVTVTADLEYLT